MSTTTKTPPDPRPQPKPITPPAKPWHFRAADAVRAAYEKFTGLGPAKK